MRKLLVIAFLLVWAASAMAEDRTQEIVSGIVDGWRQQEIADRAYYQEQERIIIERDCGCVDRCR